MTDAQYVSIWMRPERPAPGPKPAYSRAQITEAAVRIADAEGLKAATMRAEEIAGRGSGPRRSRRGSRWCWV